MLKKSSALTILFLLCLSGSVCMAYIEMQGNYVYTAIGDNGTLGAGSGTSPGILHAPAGDGVFDTDYDYLTPGSPWEVFSVRSTETGLLFNNNTNPSGGSFSAVSLAEVASSGYDHYVKWEGTSTHLGVTHEYYFNDNQERINIKTTLTALSDLTNVSFLRALDPDQDSFSYSTSTTENARGLDGNTDGDYDDAGDIKQEDWVHAVGQNSGYAIGLYTDSSQTHNTAISPGWSNDPVDYLSGSSGTVDDDTIGLAFDIGSLPSASSIILLYLYSMGDTLETADVGDSFDYAAPAITPNQRRVGSALQGISDAGGTAITTAIEGLGDNGSVRNAYDQLSGQTRPSTMPVTVSSTSRFMGLASDRMRMANGFARKLSERPLLAWAGGMGNRDSISDSSGPEASFFAAGNGTPYFSETPWGFWAKGFGLFGRRESEDSVNGYEYLIWGNSFGVDYQFTENLLAGITGGFSDGTIAYSSGHNKTDIDALHVGLYASYERPKWYLDNVLTYTNLEYEDSRYVRFGSIDQHLEGDYDGYQLSTYTEGGLNYTVGELLVQPLLGFEFSYLHQDSYNESGGSAALAYDDQSYESYKGSVGMKVSKCSRRENGQYLMTQARGRWVRELGDAEPSVSAGFASNPANGFVVRDSKICRDSAVLGAGINAGLANNTEVFLGYDAVLNADNIYHCFSAGLRFRW
ncbi:MAG: autotransporter outer membrane beta-barrel domain-containing protein [Sedimentisphaerales bacterium]|nr:autotransporter outer membrane beta-barrel domain-containing protein [Sedimentisphaerales bacterium]